MIPTLDMLQLLDRTKDYLGSTAKPSFKPEAWVAFAGLPAGTWAVWIAEHGTQFESWFILGLGLGALERAALDRMFWAAISRALTDDAPKAAQLNVWADIQGYKKEKPERPTIPVLSTAEALEQLVALGPDVLAMALHVAKESTQDNE